MVSEFEPKKIRVRYSKSGSLMFISALNRAISPSMFMESQWSSRRSFSGVISLLSTSKSSERSSIFFASSMVIPFPDVRILPAPSNRADPCVNAKDIRNL